MEQQRWLTLEEAASVLKVGVPTVQSLINRGLLQDQPGSTPPRVSYTALVEFLKQDQQTLLDEGQQPSDLGLLEDEQG